MTMEPGSMNPEYGPVWRPRVAVGWAPYRHGHWAWVGPWGWTWIDDAPWGFAPFHYGRWTHLNGGWGWIPGRRVARPVYAPALVVFVGGSGFSASMSFGGGGGVAWFPLGPREVYRPAYHVSNTYVQNLNSNHVTNINVTNVNITNITYVNRTVVGAVTAVPPFRLRQLPLRGGSGGAHQPRRAAPGAGHGLHGPGGAEPGERAGQVWPGQRPNVPPRK